MLITSLFIIVKYVGPDSYQAVNGINNVIYQYNRMSFIKKGMKYRYILQ